MRVQRTQQAQQILGTSDLVMMTQLVDDVALLIGQMVKMGLPEVFDRHIPRHSRLLGDSYEAGLPRYLVPCYAVLYKA